MKVYGATKYHSPFMENFFSDPWFRDASTSSRLPSSLFAMDDDRSPHDICFRSDRRREFRDSFDCMSGHRRFHRDFDIPDDADTRRPVERVIPIQIVREPEREFCELQGQPPRYMNLQYSDDSSDDDVVLIEDNCNGNGTHNLHKGRPAKRRTVPTSRNSRPRGSHINNGHVDHQGRVDSHLNRGGPSERLHFPPVLEIEDSLTECFRSDPYKKSTSTKTVSDSAIIKKSNIHSTPSYPVYAYLKSKLETDNRQIDYIQGDGNCFFRALSKEIYGQESFHAEVRQAVVDVIEKYPKEFEQFLDDGNTLKQHTHEMRLPSTWSTTMEIYAAATLLQRDIYVLSPDHTGDSYNWLLFSPRFSYSGSMTYHPCYITLCHTNGNHYDRIAARSRECNCGLRKPNLRGASAYVDLTNAELSVC